MEKGGSRANRSSARQKNIRKNDTAGGSKLLICDLHLSTREINTEEMETIHAIFEEVASQLREINTKEMETIHAIFEEVASQPKQNGNKLTVIFY